MNFLRFLRVLCVTVLAVLTIAATVRPEDELPNPFMVRKQFVDQRNYLSPIVTLLKDEHRYMSSPLKEPYLETMINLFNCVSDYRNVYHYENLLLAGSPSTPMARAMTNIALTSREQQMAEEGKLVNAVDALLSAAGSRQVIMVNEEHRTTFHRGLTLSLLTDLYAKGFRYLCAETITEQSASLSQKGYPTPLSGFYTVDPVYADMIRTALRLGYKVVPYESLETLRTCKNPEGKPEYCNDQRERVQAQNIYDRILKDDPAARIIVHVGRSHNWKLKRGDDFNYMAYYFKEITGIDPFTVDQVRCSERSDTTLEMPIYRYLKGRINAPSVLQFPDKSLYKHAAAYDATVFYPVMRYDETRRYFYGFGAMRKPYAVALSKLAPISDTVLIQAFYEKELADGIPVDQTIVYPKDPAPYLLLPKGKFAVRMMDKNGRILGQYNSVW